MHHLLLSTGDCLWSPKSKIPKGVVERFRPIVRVGSGRLDDTDWYVSVQLDGMPGAAAFDYFHGGPQGQGRWMGTAYLAWTEAGAKPMWGKALMGSRLLMPGVRRPTLPWLAGAITPEALLTGSSELLFQLTDIERCVGWAVYEEATQRENA